jgi:hypothetical protein
MQHLLFRQFLISTYIGAMTATAKATGIALLVTLGAGWIPYLPQMEKLYAGMLEKLLLWWRDEADPVFARQSLMRQQAREKKMASLGVQKDVVPYSIVALERDIMFNLGWGYKYPLEQAIAIANKKDNESWFDLIQPFGANQHSALFGTSATSRFEAYRKVLNEWVAKSEGRPMSFEERMYKTSTNKAISKATGLPWYNYKQ